MAGFNPLDPSAYLTALKSFGGVSTPAPALSSNFSRMGPAELAAARRQGLGGIDQMQGGLLSQPGAMGGPAAAGGWGDIFSMDSMFGATNAETGIGTNGWVGGAMQGLQSIGDMYSSMKQFGLAEDQFDESKRQYNQNYQAQVKNYNSDLEDRQRARVASNSGGYQSVDDYMAKNRQV